jgi:hypothetical protein
MLTTPARPGRIAQLSIFDVGGRRVAAIRGPSGTTLVWDSRTSAGRPARGGIYLYHIEIGAESHDGKFVVVR